ncbi:AAA family ATPase [Acetobacterium carbinolicum]|uniref:AAA family ATPase n=1 Tax=Acetobacterium carbinolicum TaxID=52690 RepID=UPI003BF4A051
MRIKKIYLKNFKGVREKHILDFESKSALLVGPNGFGKTTIYDVIELCFTGKLHRTEVNNGVTSDNKDYEKPFYQNTKGEDVIVKIWLENDSDDFIIVRYLNKNHPGRSGRSGRRNKPCDFKLLKLYKDIPCDFENDSFTPAKDNTISDKDINAFLDLNRDGESICDLYHLFNYVQQEETTFFLKKSENDRKSALGFLFQTSEAENQLEKITNRLSKLESIRSKLDGKIKMLIQSSNVDECKFERVIKHKSLDIDNEHPFDNHTLENSEIINEKLSIQIEQLKTFLGTFDPKEYEKKKRTIILDRLMNEEFLSYLVLQSQLEENELGKIKDEFQVLGDITKQKAYVLQNLIPKTDEFIASNAIYDQYTEFVGLKEFEDQIANAIKLSKRVLPAKSDELNEKVKTRSTVKSVVGTVEGSVNDIIQLRNRISEELGKLTEQTVDSTCPYCGYPWESLEELQSKFHTKEKKLKELLGEESKRLSLLDKELLDEYVIPMQTELKDYLEKNSKIDIHLINTLQAIKEQEVSQILVALLQDEEYIWKEPRSYDDIKRSLELVQKKLVDSLKMSKEVYTLLLKLENINFTESSSVLKEYDLIEALDELRLGSQQGQITKTLLESSFEKAKVIIENTKKNYTYIHEKALNEKGLFGKYFDENHDYFKVLNISDLERKQRYIDFEISKKQSNTLTLYKERITELDNAITKLIGLKGIYTKSITEYKRNMVERIKVPFYVYSAKILQNYQQGMGVFLSTKENSDSIRFLTDPTSDHDAMHHLSSGQLAVISLAFTLAINKTYNISDELKFLLIDDPIQEMDSLNIHSFIEIIRHDFVNDYQLIFSTHNDTDALYMKYQIEKVNEDGISLTNVQSLFFD